MRRIQVTIEVDPIDLDTVAAMKSVGYAVYRGPETWRVERVEELLGRESARAQAHVIVARTMSDFGLTAPQVPPTYWIRDPDEMLDERPDLALKDARRADQPDPLTARDRRWYQSDIGPELEDRRK